MPTITMSPHEHELYENYAQDFIRQELENAPAEEKRRLDAEWIQAIQYNDNSIPYTLPEYQGSVLFNILNKLKIDALTEKIFSALADPNMSYQATYAIIEKLLPTLSESYARRVDYAQGLGSYETLCLNIAVHVSHVNLNDFEGLAINQFRGWTSPFATIIREFSWIEDEHIKGVSFIG